jgi:hypothetical protein
MRRGGIADRWMELKFAILSRSFADIITFVGRVPTVFSDIIGILWRHDAPHEDSLQ